MRMPSPADLDTTPLPLHVSTPINLAMSAVRAMGGRPMTYSREDFKSVKIPQQAQLELWPRLWPWVHFIHGFFEYLAKLRECFTFDISEILFLNGFIQLLNRFLTAGAKDIMPLIWSTDGFLPLLFRAWELAEAVPEHVAENFPTLCAILLPRNFTPTQCEEAFKAAGGSLDHLADLLYRHLRQTLRKAFPVPSFTGDLTRYLPVVFQTCSFVTSVDDCLSTGLTQDTDRWPLVDSFATRGGIKLIANAFSVMTENNVKEKDLPSEIMIEQLHLLGRALLMNPKHARGALQNGLLMGIINCGLVDISAQLRAVLDWILQVVLPTSMVDVRLFDVFVKAVDAAEARQRASTHIFQTSPIFAAWTEFKVLLDGGREIHALFRQRLTLPRACDNVQCGKIAPKTRFRQCSGCSARGSTATRSVKWQIGNKANIASRALLRILHVQPINARCPNASFHSCASISHCATHPIPTSAMASS
ncbi:hypothetical protein C8F01DRAFT_463094 [Mycena amicta]|nr:hypothetical protein C8F01DRAFT_463094 [Mycena amicta]